MLCLLGGACPIWNIPKLLHTIIQSILPKKKYSHYNMEYTYKYRVHMYSLFTIQSMLLNIEYTCTLTTLQSILTNNSTHNIIQSILRNTKYTCNLNTIQSKLFNIENICTLTYVCMFIVRFTRMVQSVHTVHGNIRLLEDHSNHEHSVNFCPIDVKCWHH